MCSSEKQKEAAMTTTARKAGGRAERKNRAAAMATGKAMIEPARLVYSVVQGCQTGIEPPPRAASWRIDKASTVQTAKASETKAAQASASRAPFVTGTRPAAPPPCRSPQSHRES